MEQDAPRGNAYAVGSGLEAMLGESFARRDTSLRSAVWFADGMLTGAATTLSADPLPVASDLARRMRYLRKAHGVRYLALSFVESLSQHFVNACTRSEFSRYLQQCCRAKPSAWHSGMGKLFDACTHNDVTIVALGNVKAASVEARAAWWNKMIHLFIPSTHAYVGYTGHAERELAPAALVGPSGGFDRYVAACVGTGHVEHPDVRATVGYRLLQRA